jgi:hypothetical protein
MVRFLSTSTARIAPTMKIATIMPTIGLITVAFGVLLSVVIDVAPGETIVLNRISDSFN